MTEKNVAYEITIRKKYTEPEVIKEWKQLADSGNEYDDGKQYGYASTEKDVERSEEIFSQTLPEIDFKAIIKAVNGI